MSLRGLYRYLAFPSLMFLAALLAAPAQAEKSQDFGDFEVHFNALNTDMLPPQVAKQYDIVRSKNRGLLNVVILKKVLDTSAEPVSAVVSARSTDLTGRVRDIEMREVREANAIYYIGEFPISDQEKLRFDVSVKPQGAERAYEVRFEQQFFID